MVKRGLQSSFIIFCMLVLSTGIFAQEPQESFDATLGFEWLVDQSTNGNYGNIMTTAIAAVALKDVGSLGHADVALQYIKSQEDTDQNCWPKGDCKPLDSAFALWALDEFGEQTSSGEEWLRTAITPALKNNWWLQVLTSETGTCQVSYPDNNGATTEETIDVEEGTFPGCSATQTKTFFDLNRCLAEKNVLVNNPSASFDINCQGLGPSTIIAILFNQGNEYTLVEQAAAERYVVTINNGCFGDTSQGGCSRDVSLYINWILAELESVVDADAWLISNYDNLKAFDNSLMYLASDNEQMFLDDLVKLQKNEGSFNKDIRDTSLAVLALKQGSGGQPLTDAIDYLKAQQETDGSWDNNKLKTALALYSAFTGSAINLGPGSGPIGPSGPVCGDNFCEGDETELSCPSDCATTQEVCVVDGRCDAAFGENSANCAEDCTCGDSICDSVEQASGLCSEDCGSNTENPQNFCGNDITEGFEECDGFDDVACPGLCQADCTCEEEGRSLAWLWILIIIVLIGVGAFFFYNRYHQPGKKKSGKRPEYKPFTSMLESQKKPPQKMKYTPPRSSQRSSKVDDELDRSIKEAKKLLKKL